MKYDNSDKLYMQIGAGRLLDIRVFLDDIEVYNGMVEDAPQEIKTLRYSKIIVTDKYEYYTYSKFNNL